MGRLREKAGRAEGVASSTIQYLTSNHLSMAGTHPPTHTHTHMHIQTHYISTLAASASEIPLTINTCLGALFDYII